ncbi:hypothetical protein FQN57_003300 [Myotisia sp. PD_48]|nr:hypothetical protein FQN57_003300 [Myotisia sp. PD_48]
MPYRRRGRVLLPVLLLWAIVVLTFQQKNLRSALIGGGGLAWADVSPSLVVPKTTGENVSWVEELPPYWTPFIYTVDKEPGYPLQSPANRGRESIVFLTFIIDNYNSLPNITVFSHAKDIQWHNDVAGNRTIDNVLNLRVAAVKEKGYVNMRCHWNPGCPISVNPLAPTEGDIRIQDMRASFADIYTHFFNVTRDEVPKAIGSVCCAQFAVTRERIRARPREDYVRMRDWSMETRLGPGDIGWVFEKIWHIVFMEEPVL